MKNLFILLCSTALATSDLLSQQAEDRIQPYSLNPWYWEYNGEAVFLIGGSDDDNPFQWPSDQLEAHLDLLASVGGNFVRNVMSTRDEGNLVPYAGQNGYFQLSQWNDEYWRRLDFFLQETAQREIIVQLTLWDQHDFVAGNWEGHFWNPDNNGIGLKESRVYDGYAFFSAVESRNALILPYQMKYVEKILEHSLKYDHVIYNINNEGWAGLQWEQFWAEFTHAQAEQAGKQVEVTTMEHGPRLSVDAVLQSPQLFSYFEISQNNNSSTGYEGREHWEHIYLWRQRISEAVGPRPMVNEKVYGSPEAPVSMGDGDEAERRFWRIAFAGCSSVRFHRPTSGLGLGERAQALIRALRALADEIDITHSQPTPQVIQSSSGEGAYCLSGENGSLAIYLPDGGDVRLRVDNKRYSKRRLLIEDGLLSEAEEATSSNGTLRLKASIGETKVFVLTPL